jgi:hypothetical protein
MVGKPIFLGSLTAYVFVLISKAASGFVSQIETGIFITYHFWRVLH